MVAEKFTMLIGAIFFVALASVIIVLISDAQQDLDGNILGNLRTVTLVNVTDGESSSGINSVAGTILNATPKFIRGTPEFSCTDFYIWNNATGTGAPSHRDMKLTTGTSVVAGETEVFCVTTDGTSLNDTHGPYSAGTVILMLTGNSSNSSALLGKGFGFNISYSAKNFDASWNTSKELQQQYLSGGNTQAQYFTLIILAILLVVGGFLLTMNMFKGGDTIGKGFSGFGGGGGASGGFMNSFER